MTNATISIGDFVSRAGLTESTLRMWERRHGFPAPARTPSGQRRYTEEQLEEVRRVLAGREAGLSLPAAIERAHPREPAGRLSVFATLRRMAPDLEVRLVGKRAMVVLSHAIEDECLARAGREVMIACFQQERFYRQEQSRWRELSQAAVTMAFADFGCAAAPIDGPAEIPIAELPSLAREWAIVGYGSRSAICMAGREPPSSSVDAPTDSRSFEMLWTVDPATVRAIAGTCAAAAAAQVPEIGTRSEPILDLEPALSAEEQLRLATTVINRTLSGLR